MQARCFRHGALIVACVSCSSSATPTQATVPDGSSPGPSHDDASGTTGADAGNDATDASVANGSSDATAPGQDVASADAPVLPCSTRVTYGSAWMHPANHAASFDVMAAEVTWDGKCTDDGANSYAVLSDGSKPSFQGNGACILALDYSGTCAGVATACTTRVTYGSTWIAAANHPASYDDVTGRVFSDGVCHNSGTQSSANLSNGWAPVFSGNGGCRLSFEYTQCGGLYENPVIPGDCPDPGVLHDGNTYVLTCTSGDAQDAYPIYTSTDLATWTLKGHVFPAGHHPAWAKQDFWAPEIHKVGAQYVVYFSARGADNVLAVGAASAPTALGPFTPLAQPLVHDSAMGLIDASEINAPDGPYVLWKEDGNAVGKPTPIRAQALTSDGLALQGTPSTLITNDQAWEGAVTEGPFMVAQGGSYYLFYSGNSYANATYAVGVARATSPTGPFTKANGPLVVTGGPWVGPGHCSVVDGPSGGTAMIYHAWKTGCVNAPGCGREVLVDEVVWQAGWPTVPLAPSSNSRPGL